MRWVCSARNALASAADTSALDAGCKATLVMLCSRQQDQCLWCYRYMLCHFNGYIATSVLKCSVVISSPTTLLDYRLFDFESLNLGWLYYQAIRVNHAHSAYCTGVLPMLITDSTFQRNAAGECCSTGPWQNIHCESTSQLARRLPVLDQPWATPLLQGGSSGGAVSPP